MSNGSRHRLNFIPLAQLQPANDPTRSPFRRAIHKARVGIFHVGAGVFKSALLALAILVNSGAANAQLVPTSATIGFENLGVSTLGVHMPTNYGGFSWNNTDWHYLSLASSPSNTFLALSGAATSIVRTGGGNFYFDGADFWSRRGLDAIGSFYFILHLDGALVYDGRDDPDGRMRFTGEKQHFTPNYSGLVDVVAVVFRQGGDDWDHLAMDNFQFRTELATESPTNLNLSNQPGGCLFQFNGTPGQAYTVEARTNLTAGSWIRIGGVTTDVNGAGQFLDGNASSDQCFYRAVFP